MLANQGSERIQSVQALAKVKRMDTASLLEKKKDILKTAAKDGARNIRILARWLEARLDRSNEIFANEERKRCSTGGKIIDAPTFIGRTGVA
jgi:hypothetical protein